MVSPDYSPPNRNRPIVTRSVSEAALEFASLTLRVTIATLRPITKASRVEVRRGTNPFPHPARRTGRAVFPHPALGQGS